MRACVGSVTGRCSTAPPSLHLRLRACVLCITGIYVCDVCVLSLFVPPSLTPSCPLPLSFSLPTSYSLALFGSLSQGLERQGEGGDTLSLVHERLVCKDR